MDAGIRSRDPIGFKGSKWNLYEYVGSRPTVKVDPMGLYVVGDEWWDWYFHRNGDEMDLETDAPGIYSAWVGSPITQRAITQLKEKARDLMWNAFFNECGSSSKDYARGSFAVEYGPISEPPWTALFPIGNTTLSGFVGCSFSVSCAETGQTRCPPIRHYQKCVTMTCTGVLHLRDEFIDVVDVRDWWDAVVDVPGSTPYSFKAKIKFDHKDRECRLYNERL